MPHLKEIFVKWLPAAGSPTASPQAFFLLSQGSDGRLLLSPCQIWSSFPGHRVRGQKTLREGTHANRPRPLGGNIGKRWQKNRTLPGTEHGAGGAPHCRGLSLGPWSLLKRSMTLPALLSSPLQGSAASPPLGTAGHPPCLAWRLHPSLTVSCPPGCPWTWRQAPAMFLLTSSNPSREWDVHKNQNSRKVTKVLESHRVHTSQLVIHLKKRKFSLSSQVYYNVLNSRWVKYLNMKRRHRRCGKKSHTHESMFCYFRVRPLRQKTGKVWYIEPYKICKVLTTKALYTKSTHKGQAGENMSSRLHKGFIALIYKEFSQINNRGYAMGKEQGPRAGNP